MASTIITLIIAGIISMQFARKWRFNIFSLGTLLLLVPVRWVVFPVSEYMKIVSAEQFFVDQKIITMGCLQSVWNAPLTGQIDWAFFIPGCIFVLAIFAFVFRVGSEMIQDRRQAT